MEIQHMFFYGNIYVTLFRKDEVIWSDSRA